MPAVQLSWYTVFNFPSLTLPKSLKCLHVPNLPDLPLLQNVSQFLRLSRFKILPSFSRTSFFSKFLSRVIQTFPTYTASHAYKLPTILTCTNFAYHHSIYTLSNPSCSFRIQNFPLLQNLNISKLLAGLYTYTFPNLPHLHSLAQCPTFPHRTSPQPTKVKCLSKHSDSQST